MNQKSKFKQTEIGEIPEDWEIKELKEVLDKKGYIRGPFGSALRRPELKSEGIPVYEQANAIYNHRDFRFFIDENKYQELKRFTVRENDLIISCSGTFGKVSIISKEDLKGIISQALLILRPNTNKINPHFLKYFFISKIGYESIASRSMGSVQVNIAKRDIIERIPLGIPSIEEQERIVKILSDLDSKIELLQNQNKTLESIGKALFKHWFVDFEFPNEEGKPYKSSSGEMVESELGEIPKRWEVTPLGELFKFVKGKKPKDISKELKENYQIQILIKTLDGKKPVFANSEKMIFVNKNDPIMVMDGASSGRIEIGFNGILGSTLALLKINNKIFGNMIYYFLKDKENDIRQNTTGTSIPHTDKNKVNMYNIPIPENEFILNKFQNDTSKIINKTILNIHQIRSLQKTRDSLLPKLMSGKIRVPLEMKT